MAFIGLKRYIWEHLLGFGQFELGGVEQLEVKLPSIVLGEVKNKVPLIFFLLGNTLVIKESA